MTLNDYLNFELDLDSSLDGEYSIAVRSPAGEWRETVRFPFWCQELDRNLTSLDDFIGIPADTSSSTLSRNGLDLQLFGQVLFNALFVGEIRNLFDVSKQRAAAQETGLRVVLHIRPPKLVLVPWEILFDPRNGEYLSLVKFTPVVRYLDLPLPPQSLLVKPPLRILGLAVSPRDLMPIDVKQEKTWIARALAKLRKDGLIHLEWVRGQTWEDLQQAMRGGPWHVLHYIGHGGYDLETDEGFVVLADQANNARQLGALEFARLLGDHQSMRLVVLNSCEGGRTGATDVFSGTTATLLRRGIPAVLAMQDPLIDRAATRFSQSFYESLASAMPVDVAVTEGRVTLSLAFAGEAQWSVPVLYMRAPDGHIFNFSTTLQQTGVVSSPVTPDQSPPFAGARAPKYSTQVSGNARVEKIITIEKADQVTIN